MSRIYISLIFLAGTTVISCGTRKADKLPPENPTDVTSHEVITHDIKTISQGALFCNEEVIVPSGGIVISTNDEWQDLLKQMNSVNDASNGFNQPPVNFDEEMVIGYFDEIRGSLNTTVQIESITEKLSGLIVNYYVTTNNADPAAEVMNQPYMLVRMRKRNKTVTFASTF